MTILSFISATLNSAHNLFQALSWGVTLYLLLSYIATGSPPCWKECLMIAQYSQAFDIVLSAAGLTKNNFFTVFQ